jgi:hypothetical protein
MGTPTVAAALEQPKLAIVAHRRTALAPADNVYTENPMGAFRGLAFALIFNVLLALSGAAAFVLYRLLR